MDKRLPLLVGLLAVCVCRFVLFTLTDGLITFDLARWYAWRGLVELAAVAVITLYGFRVSIGNKSIFGTALEKLMRCCVVFLASFRLQEG